MLLQAFQGEMTSVLGEGKEWVGTQHTAPIQDLFIHRLPYARQGQVYFYRPTDESVKSKMEQGEARDKIVECGAENVDP